MGAWGVLAFENDSAGDWAYELSESDDLSFIEETLDEVINEKGYLDSDPACMALAACEVLARLRGRTGQTDAYTETADSGVAAHRDRLIPSPELLDRAQLAIDRILGEDSELRDLWDESDGKAWRAGVEDLRNRLRG